MKLTEYIPADSLLPFIKSYRVIESQEARVNRVLPGTSFTLAFRVGGQVSYVNSNNEIILPKVTFSGLRKSVRLIGYAPRTTTIIVLFKESGISAFFRRGAHELYEQSVSIDNYFLPSEVSMVEEKLESARDNKSRVKVIEQFLLSHLTQVSADNLVSKAIAKICSVNGNVRMKELAGELCISQDAFEKRFRKSTGATPKQFSHIVKMNFVIRQYRIRPSFLDMAFENGFYDQSHLTRDFKNFTGQTPTEFFRSASYW